MKKTIIYAVNSGCYSDYRVDALFSTKEKAEEFMKDFPDPEYNDIDEYVLDNNISDLKRRGYSPWNITILKNGDIESVARMQFEKYSLEEKFYILERTKVSLYVGKNIPDALCAIIMAKTENQAIKIANEKRAMMIACGEWK